MHREKRWSSSSRLDVEGGGSLKEKSNTLVAGNTGVHSTMNVSEKTENRISPEAVLSRFHCRMRTKSQVIQKSPNPSRSVERDVSLRSNRSFSKTIAVRGGQQVNEPSQRGQESRDPPVPRGVETARRRSIFVPITFRDGQQIDEPRVRCDQNHQVHQDIFMLLEENIITFVKKEVMKLRKFMGPGNQEVPLEELTEDEDAMDEEEDQKRNYNKEVFLNMALHFLRTMKQKQLVESLQSKILAAKCQHELKSSLKKKSECLLERAAPLNQIYTELHITGRGNEEVNDQHKIKQIETGPWTLESSELIIRCEDIFTSLPGRQTPVKTLVTKGVAGIGKTVLTQKYTLDWAEDKANHNIQLIFPFTFQELNLLEEKNYSLVELLHHVFTETKEAGICRFEDFEVVFIFDGLDECRLPLDFKNNVIVTDVTESTSLDVLLTNLIRGNLLPSAHLWITTRPAAANQIPPEFVDMVTEVRGFTDPQKEEYFRKRFRDKEQASTIISHIKSSQSLHIMCHIPVFCWITATVLEHMLEIGETSKLPKTLTEMYIHFLVVQTTQGKVKYHGGGDTDSVWISKSKKTILALGKLAFEQLEKGNLIFYEEDLKECGIDIKAASVYSGLFTELFREECGLNRQRVFCFVHLSIHEFLAALYVFVTFIDNGVDKLSRRQLRLRRISKMKRLYQTAVDRSLQSQNGHLDLFVRFLLGLSLENNQTLIRSLLKKTASKANVKEKIVQYIKNKIKDCRCQVTSINLFHCLSELNDHSIVEEIQEYLTSENIHENKLSPSQWSALVFIFLSSQKHLDVFDLKKFSTSDEGLQALLPVVRASKTSLLSCCNLSWRSCDALATVLISKNSNLRELDLSNNDLQDTGVKLLSAGLGSPRCRLEVLRLSGCLITEEGCAAIALALSYNHLHLKELDLSFNHPGDSAIKQLLEGLKDPHWKLEKLNLEHCGKCRLKPSFLRYFCRITLDPNTAHRNLSLFDDNKEVMVVKEEQQYPDHPERFDSWKQLLCSDGLTGHCYWEVKWNGRVNIGVTYRGIRRSGYNDDCCIGWNDQSWSLICSPKSYTAWHNNTATDINTLPLSNRVAVYVDWLAGTVSFYCLPSEVSSIERIHLHTFHSTFSEPLYPAFGFGQMLDLNNYSTLLPSVFLSQVEDFP